MTRLRRRGCGGRVVTEERRDLEGEGEETGSKLIKLGRKFKIERIKGFFSWASGLKALSCADFLERIPEISNLFKTCDSSTPALVSFNFIRFLIMVWE